MSNQTIPDDSKPSRQVIYNIASGAELTGRRIDSILKVVDSLASNLIVYDDSAPYESSNGPTGRFEGGALQATEATYITALNRLDKILEDDAQWVGVPIDQMLADTIEETNALEKQSANCRLAILRDACRPYRKVPTQVLLIEGRFIACVGQLGSVGCIATEGSSVEEALSKLDLILSSKSSPNSDSNKLT
jgi:hypothetical protein